MNIKHYIWAITLSGWLLAQSCDDEILTNKTNTISYDTYIAMADTMTRSELLELLNSDILAYPANINRDSLYNEYKLIADRKPNTDTLKIDMNRIKEWPLWTMAKLSKNLAALLWYHGYNKDLLIQYNPELSHLFESKNLEQIWYNEIKIQTLKTPAVYPDLVNFAKPALQDFLQDKPQRIQDSLQHDQEVIIITRNEYNKVVTLYYDKGTIQFAQYSSPWIWWIVKEYDHRIRKKRNVNRYTPEAILYTNYNKDLLRHYYKKDSLNTIVDSIPYSDKDDRQNPKRVSRSFGNAPMPYAIPILNTPKQNGIFLHQGKSNGDRLSHGCARQTGQIAMELFDRIDNRIVKVAIFNIYDKK